MWSRNNDILNFNYDVLVRDNNISGRKNELLISYTCNYELLTRSYNIFRPNNKTAKSKLHHTES